MLKNISILHFAYNADITKQFVEKVMRTARYKGQLQFVFYVKPDNKQCKDLVQELYMRYPPSLYDPHPIPTVKVISNNDDSISWITQCTEKSDAPIMLVAALVDDLISKFPEHWDMHYLDTKIDGMTPREYHHLKTEEVENTV